MKKLIPHDYLKKLLDYDSSTGDFTRKIKTSNRVNVGDVAGCLTAGGYIHMNVGGYKCYAHRLAWFYMHGLWPKDQIDHINGNRSDNRWFNLREATNHTNRKNMGMRSNNTSGVMGVSWHKQMGKWNPSIKADGRKKSLGLFFSLSAASIARKAAEIKYGYHENHGSRRYEYGDKGSN